MKAKATLHFTSYFTINTSFLLLLEFFSLNHHRNHVQIFISVFYIAAAAILHRHPNSGLLGDDDHDRDAITDADCLEEHHELLECRRTGESDGDGCDRDSEACGGYEGDDEDDGEDEDDGLSDKIEEFIAGRKREWKEEIIRERALCFEATSF